MPQQHRYGDAERQVGQAIEINPNIAAAHYNRGLALMKLDRIKDALTSLDECIALEPGHSQALALRTEALKAIGRIPASVA
ncbi:tetratricopeptide repeat protein [Mesorhizobium sp.]|uniref:tetratricopeptide repeat protein n=1 Tax=Mesorhizobium sp. TaxID=1871066 RepID=UPI0025BFC1EF|nr:tetratricopeptide repeat protein [Mesorhizobium sp.]